MTSLLGKARLPLCLLASLLPTSGSAQCPSDAWSIFSATGDVAEVAVTGSRAWVAAVGGVISIDLTTIRNERPSQFRLTDADGLISPEVTCLTIDAFGNVWVGTREDGVSVFDASGGHIKNLFAFDALLWSDKVIAAGAVGELETCVFDFGSGPESVSCARVAVSSADTYNASNGQPEGGGFVIVEIVNRGGEWIFQKPGIGSGIERSQELLSEVDQVWVGTGGNGLWRRDNETGQREQVLSVNQGGLVNDNVKKLARAPVAGQAGPDLLWIGTAGGLHTWNGTVLDTVPQFLGRNILDLYRTDDRMYVLAEVPSAGSDLYQIDLTQPIDTLRIPRSNCTVDSLYVPREVAVAGDGKIVLGSRSRSFFVRDGFDWICPPPLGPHWPRTADLDLGPDGVLYFGTGDQNRQPDVNGVGVYDGFEWSSITAANSNLLDGNMTEIESWPDSTRWFGSRVSASVGGVNRYFPVTGALTQYHPAAGPGRRTLGRNIWSMAKDTQENLWICYGQEGGGLSVIEWPSEDITNFPFDTMFTSATTALRDISFDTYGRVWVTTQSSGTTIGKVYVVDTKGTISNRVDDKVTEFNVANEIGTLGEIRAITVDRSNQVWLAGNLGLAVGQITDGGGDVARVDWEVLRPTSTQLGGRNPLPYRISVLDDDDHVWIGTEASGLVRISPDRSVWTWFDQGAGCALPDQSITGLHWDGSARAMWIGTPSSGIARVALAGEQTAAEQSVEAYPNPWRPAEQGAFVTFGGIPTDEITTIRIYNTAGELVREMPDVGRGDKTWNGQNVGGVPVESGVYVVTATSSDGTSRRYEGKVAIIR